MNEKTPLSTQNRLVIAHELADLYHRRCIELGGNTDDELDVLLLALAAMSSFKYVRALLPE